MEIKSVGVVGAGQMGNGIAHVMALAGYEVRLNDVSQDALDKAAALIRKNMDRQVSREAISAEDRDAALDRIRTTLELSQVAKTDLVIEAATEREEVKNKIFEALVPELAENTILTSNTSSISITRLASRTDRPERFMGGALHFIITFSCPSPEISRTSSGFSGTKDLLCSCVSYFRRAASLTSSPTIILPSSPISSNSCIAK